MSDVPVAFDEIVRRRVAEIYRERRLEANKREISKIDFAREQKLIAMSAPLVSQMAVSLRRSATSLEVVSTKGTEAGPVLYLNREMAARIETAIVDQQITAILGDIKQFNKDNGWGKLKIADRLQPISFNIPSDILPRIRRRLIDHMKVDQVYLQAYFVRDRSGQVTRLIVVGILETPAD